MFLFAEINCTNDDQDSLERRLMCRGLNIRPGGVRPNLEDYVRIVDNSLVSIQRVLVTRLTYNCAHLRLTKESLTDSVKKNCVRKLGENFFE